MKKQFLVSLFIPPLFGALLQALRYADLGTWSARTNAARARTRTWSWAIAERRTVTGRARTQGSRTPICTRPAG
ncbi:MAG: hypothetical protein U0821_03505 [Chloroflexota bacterium]